MTAQQKKTVSEITNIINQVSMIGAFLGSIVTIMMIGEFKGRVETTILTHDRRIDRVEAKAELCELKISSHHGDEK